MLAVRVAPELSESDPEVVPVAAIVAPLATVMFDANVEVKLSVPALTAVVPV